MDRLTNLTPDKKTQNTIDEKFALIKQEKGEIPYGLTNDYMFRAVFQKSAAALKGILAAVLKRKPEDIISCEIMNPIILGETINNKTCILDIRVLLNGQEKIDVEMQLGHFSNWPKRSVYYLCSMFTDAESGKDYNTALPCVHIGFVKESPFEEVDEFISQYWLINPENGHVYTDALSLIMVDLSWPDRQSEKQNAEEDDEKAMEETVVKKTSGKVKTEGYEELRKWVSLLCAESWEEAMEVSEDSLAMKEAVVTMRELSASEKIRLQCEARLRYQGDMKSAEMYGEKRGEKRGVERINDLNRRLVRDNRLDDLTRSLTDSKLQQKLLKEYAL